MITGKFDELYNKYADATYIRDRRIKVKLKEIIACQEECDPAEHEFTYEIIDKFCELINLIEEKNEEALDVLRFKYGEFDEVPDPGFHRFMTVPVNPNSRREDSFSYKDPIELLDDFFDSFVDKKSPSTMRDYAARIKTFAYSDQYLNEMLASGELGIREIKTDPVLFTYENIELILARFNTKDENGVTVKQRNNIRSALRLLNDFKRKKNSDL